MEKRGEPGIFSHVSDVTTNEKLMSVGGLNDNSVIAHALVPGKMVREFVCVMPSNRALRLLCKVYVFCRRLKTEKHEWIAGVSTSLPFRCTLYFVLSQRGCFKSDVY